jgi:hypothetical protein
MWPSCTHTICTHIHYLIAANYWALCTVYIGNTKQNLDHHKMEYYKNSTVFWVVSLLFRVPNILVVESDSVQISEK